MEVCTDTKILFSSDQIKQPWYGIYNFGFNYKNLVHMLATTLKCTHIHVKNTMLSS